MMKEEFLWVEKYRPRKVGDIILPRDIQDTLQKFVDDKNVPNLLLVGPSGVGKTTAAKAILEELGADYIVINGSLEGGIETLRTHIQQFATSTSLMGGRKYVILDEADYLTPHMQPALRNFMEEFSSNCGFILTANYRNRIIPAIQSRCSSVDFKISHDEAVTLCKHFMQNCIHILREEGIPFVADVLAAVIKKHYPDFRRVLNELQYYSARGHIDNGILNVFRDVSLNKLMGYMKSKNFTSVRQWVADNSQMDTGQFYRKFYDHMNEYIKPNDLPYLVVLIAKYSYQDVLAADKEINLAAFLTEVMANCEFK